MRRPLPVAGLILWSLFVSPAIAAGPPPERGAGMVASDHPLASACGASVLARGGNAVDAAVATALCAGVVQPASSGLGGGGFAVLVDPSGATRVVDFREEAPAGAARDMYRGAAAPDASTVGGLAVAVPAESRGLVAVHATGGVLSLAQVAAPAVRLAQRGFPVAPHLAERLGVTKAPEVLAAFSVDGRTAGFQDVLRRPDLAGVLRRWAASGGESLHTGRDAAAVVAHVADSGGMLTAEDLAGYDVVARDAIEVSFGAWRIRTMPPPSSGGVLLAQMLRVLEGYDLASFPRDSAAQLHLLTEVMKHAYADRAHHLGDPGFVDVPVKRLLSDARIAEIRSKIDLHRTFPPEHYGALLAPPQDAGTQHISVLDADGRAVALTTTINTGFGSGLVVPGTGIVLNNQMDDFSTAGVPNAYGLMGSEANAIEPGKRPLSSMTPTVVLDEEGQVRLVIGASGGSNIPSAVLQVLLDVLVYGVDPAAAVASPRVHHQWLPNTLFVEPDLPIDVIDALRAIGHKVEVRGGFSAVQAIVRQPDGWAAGGSDPRKGGAPAGSGRP